MPIGVYKRKPYSAAHRKAISDALLGNPCYKDEERNRKISEARKGKNNPMYGKSPPLEQRLKISESLKKTKARTRIIGFQELLHEIRHSPMYKLWREAVYKRDKYTCIWCGYDKGGKLNADHIKPFILIVRQNKVSTFEDAIHCGELWDITNGRTLCKECHMTTDTWGSKASIWNS